jgi:hypothetical protein
MLSMNHHRRLGFTAFLLILTVAFSVSRGAAQTPAAGSVEFTASVRPTDGRPEPVREMSFYLLRKSMADIRREAEQAEHPVDMDHFIDGLQVSPELKDWMKKHHVAAFVGEKFTKLLTPDDIVGVPEFFDAYNSQNGAALGGGPPIPGYKEKDKEKNPEKYAQAHEEYKKRLRQYVAANPDTVQALDVELREKDPGRQWAQLEGDQQQRVARRTLLLAQTKYLAARTDSDLDGRGIFAGVAPGSYWITTLDTPALSGDARLRWDFTVNVRPAETTRVELSNLNALESENLTAQ